MTINIPTPKITSWKTTISGIASMALGVLQGTKHTTLAQAFQDPLVQFALLVGLLGIFAKDSNVTGGTKGTPSTPEALAEANQAPSARSIEKKESQ